ncbi:MAG: FkbM family methyltransferase [Sphingopyxis sp.]
MLRKIFRAIGVLSPSLFDWLQYHWHISYKRAIIYPTVAAPMFRIMGARNKSAIDIGANHGVATRFLRRHFRAVHAVEPVPFLANRLRRAKLAAVTVHNTALGGSEGMICMRVPVDDQGNLIHVLTTASDANALTMFQNDGVVQFDVPVQRLDTLCAAISGPIGYIKIDVEGFEYEVLSGGSATIARHRPVIQLEIERTHNSDGGAVMKLMRDWGYVPFSIAPDRLREDAESALAAQLPMVALSHDEAVPHQFDFLFIPDEQVRLYRPLLNR